jgi:hypothetical protein
MKKSIARGLVLSMLAVGCGGADTVSELEIDNAWARPTPAESSVAAVYLSVTSPVADELIAASSTMSTSASLHATSTEGADDGGSHSHHGGASSEMVMSETELKLEPNSTVELVPGGLHVMLEGLRRRLVEGETFELVLTFREAGERTIVVNVSTNEPVDR